MGKPRGFAESIKELRGSVAAVAVRGVLFTLSPPEAADAELVRDIWGSMSEVKAAASQEKIYWHLTRSAIKACLPNEATDTDAEDMLNLAGGVGSEIAKVSRSLCGMPDFTRGQATADEEGKAHDAVDPTSTSLES